MKRQGKSSSRQAAAFKDLYARRMEEQYFYDPSFNNLRFGDEMFKAYESMAVDLMFDLDKIAYFNLPPLLPDARDFYCQLSAFFFLPFDRCSKFMANTFQDAALKAIDWLGDKKKALEKLDSEKGKEIKDGSAGASIIKLIEECRISMVHAASKFKDQVELIPLICSSVKEKRDQKDYQCADPRNCTHSPDQSYSLDSILDPSINDSAMINLRQSLFSSNKEQFDPLKKSSKLLAKLLPEDCLPPAKACEASCSCSTKRRAIKSKKQCSHEGNLHVI